MSWFGVRWGDSSLKDCWFLEEASNSVEILYPETKRSFGKRSNCLFTFVLLFNGFYSVRSMDELFYRTTLSEIKVDRVRMPFDDAKIDRRVKCHRQWEWRRLTAFTSGRMSDWIANSNKIHQQMRWKLISLNGWTPYIRDCVKKNLSLH